MATKKTVSKKTSSASGSDRGAKMKADAAQKKSQAKTASQRKTSPQRYSSTGDELMSQREYNSRAGDLSGMGLFVSGRLAQRQLNQVKKENKKRAESLAKSSRTNLAPGASRVKVAKGKK
jgi:hypothetical protein